MLCLIGSRRSFNAMAARISQNHRCEKMWRRSGAWESQPAKHVDDRTFLATVCRGLFRSGVGICLWVRIVRLSYDCNNVTTPCKKTSRSAVKFTSDLSGQVRLRVISSWRYPSAFFLWSESKRCIEFRNAAVPPGYFHGNLYFRVLETAEKRQYVVLNCADDHSYREEVTFGIAVV